MSHPGRIHRLLRLITLLQGAGGQTVNDLMRELGVSRRTLFRDLNLLETAGVPYFHEQGTGYRVAPSFFLPPINLTVPETLGLLLLGKTAAQQRDRPLQGAALAAIQKLTATVPDPIRTACGELMQQISVNTGARLAAADVETRHYCVLQRCIDEARVCRIQYKSPVEADVLSCTLDPYALHFANRAWYVLGKTDAHKEVRVLKLARLRSVEPMEKLFHKPKGFRVSDKLGHAWQLNPEGRLYKIELEFSPLVATNVSEVLWHPSQRNTMLPDGRCHMSFTVDGLKEIAWWICGYADQVTVLKPVALRHRVRDMLQAALRRYDGDK